jgi:hypothetical protein
MAEADRRRLLERALALPHAPPADFFGGRRPPEGLQSPKGPQRIASILRIYPNFDAPSRKTSNGASKPVAKQLAPARSGLPSVEEMERLLARVRELEHHVARELAEEIDARIASLKRSLVDLEGDELETAYRELGDALERKRAQAAQTRFEVFRRIESDAEFSERAFLRFIRR